MNGYLRQSTASQVCSIGPFVDDTDFKTLEDGLTINNTDIVISKVGGADTTKASGGATAHGAGGIYTLTWDATDSNTVGELFYSVKVVGALVVFGTYIVLEEAVYDALLAASAIGYVADQPVNVTKWLGTAASTPTVAGIPNVNVKTWNDLTTVALPLVPTTAGRTLDVSAGGEAGIDWANVGSPTTAVDLSGTTIKTTQKVDVDTIKTNPVVNAGTITFPTTATLASTTNITAGTITTATNVTTVNGLAAGVITAAAIATDAIDADALAADAVTEIQSGLATQASVNTIDDFLDTEVAAILAAVDTEVASILASLPDGFTKNTAFSNFEFLMVDELDNVTGKTGLSITAARSIDGGAFAGCANTASEVANGLYKINLAASDLNGDMITFKFTSAGADATFITIKTET